MNYKFGIKLALCSVTCVCTLGIMNEDVTATGLNAGISSYTSNVVMAGKLPTAGFSLAMSDCVASVEDEAIIASAQPAVSENETVLVASSGTDMLVADVNDYVNIRSEASKESEGVGKLYKDNVGQILEQQGDWYLITSGNVTGWVNGEYITVGDEQAVRAVGKRIATVTANGLCVRSGPSTEDSIRARVSDGDKLTVLDESEEGWVEISYRDKEGFVCGDYVELSTEFTYAESKEEEAARLKKEEEERKAREASRASRSSSSSSRNYVAPTGSTGADVASYALQFVGNPYVYGGTSLTNGTDCSGFVMSVYRQFGVSLPHSSRSQRGSGYGVSQSEMQPGDIVCYSGHVGIYIGNGQIVHASNRRDGIKVSNVSYRALVAVRRIFSE